MIRVTVLGCGGSAGVPLVGGNWGDCDPANPRNRRRRPSILLESETTSVLVDTGPDLRCQLLDASVRKLDAIIYTHDHADHTHGLDDLRPLLFGGGGPIPAYGDKATLGALEARFGYAFTTVTMDRGLYRPYLEPRPVDGPIIVGDLEITPFTQDHGYGPSLGLRCGGFAYSTDVVRLDETAFAVLEGVDVWVVDAVREKPHASHAHLDLTLSWIERVRPRVAYLTHMNHTLDYDQLSQRLPQGVTPAHDGLVIEIPD